MAKVKRTMNKDYYIEVLEVIREHLGDAGALEALALALNVDELEATLGYIVRVHDIKLGNVTFWDGFSTITMKHDDEEVTS